MFTTRAPDFDFDAAFFLVRGEAAFAVAFFMFRAATVATAGFFTAAFLAALLAAARFAPDFFAATLVGFRAVAVRVAFLLAEGFPLVRDFAVFLAMGAGKVS
ncbi:MAG: hypothetical protein JNJ91_14830 [Flavobacteriales bacterium]|nr:hypothetical protein [Flavobacteriales bacterium]